MKVIFYYSSVSEEGVIQETLQDRQFIIKNNYEYWLPTGVTLDSPINKIRSAIKNELIPERMHQVQTSIEDSLADCMPLLKAFAQQTRLLFPSKLVVTLTQYGTAGSYELPNQVFINIRSNYGNPFSAFVHELVHILVEKPVVERYRLSHSAKEGLVDYLILHSSHLHRIVPQYSVQDTMVAPSKQQIKKWLPKNDFLSLATT